MMEVSRETDALFDAYAALIAQWNPKINLIASSTLSDFKSRHIEDCIQIAALSAAPIGRWVDIGSGGGLPGIVLSIAFREEDIKFTLIESDQRKCVFLRTVIRELGLKNTTVLSERIEAIQPLNADYISARALAGLPSLLGYVHQHLSPAGTAWLMKGRKWREECDAARATWQFDLEDFPSKTDPDAAILKISGVTYA
jgi:16S rRNA (guanine527-N7)-methyltransferase